MLKYFRADLHIHSCLSPCADLTMSPRRIVEKAVERHLDIIAICDHNSAENTNAAVVVGKEHHITVLPGMEINSVEETHLIALFDRVTPLLKLQKTVYKHLPPGKNREEIFGEQIIANEKDEVEGFNQRILSGAVSITLKELVERIHFLGGLAIAAHIDREVFGIIGQLGFIPENLELNALEISARMTPPQAKKLFPGIEKFPLISSSDAHFLDEIGKKTVSFLLETPKLKEVNQAFLKIEGRDLEVQ